MQSETSFKCFPRPCPTRSLLPRHTSPSPLARPPSLAFDFLPSSSSLLLLEHVNRYVEREPKPVIFSTFGQTFPTFNELIHQCTARDTRERENIPGILRRGCTVSNCNSNPSFLLSRDLRGRQQRRNQMIDSG